MREITSLEVSCNGRRVGTLAETVDHKVAFQYCGEWLANGFSISPLSLPLSEKTYVPQKEAFDGLFGVFDDSLPDGWGRLLVDRMLLRNHIDPGLVSPLSRLGIVGSNGMGALEYRPELMEQKNIQVSDYDRLSAECEKILNDTESEELDTLVMLGGSSGGARPKVFISHSDEKWMVKFPSNADRKTIGEEEYLYVKCAEKCGINVPEVRLFESKICSGYFGAKRYDRFRKTDGTWQKRHVVTAGGLLETSHRIPNLDYGTLLKLTAVLTKDHTQSVEMYRRMCFNVFAHNRDDHAKNFSYLYNEEENRWQLSPAYDLTYSNSIGGEHATTVYGNGINPGVKELINVAKDAGISESKAKKIAMDIQEIVKTELGDIIRSYQSEKENEKSI